MTIYCLFLIFQHITLHHLLSTPNPSLTAIPNPSTPAPISSAPLNTHLTSHLQHMHRQQQQMQAHMQSIMMGGQGIPSVAGVATPLATPVVAPVQASASGTTLVAGAAVPGQQVVRPANPAYLATPTAAATTAVAGTPAALLHLAQQQQQQQVAAHRYMAMQQRQMQAIHQVSM